MKRTIASFLLFSLTGLVSIQLYAQQRSIDMEVTIDSPAEGSYPSGQAVPLTVSVINNGPDSIRVGDTLFVILPDGDLSWGTMEEAVHMGGTAELFTFSISMPNVQQTETFDLCVQLVDDPSSTITVGGEPFNFSYIDPIPANNVKCNRIAVETNTSAIAVKDDKYEALQFVPNPAQKKVYVSIPNNMNGPVTITIRDLVGRTVTVNTINSLAGLKHVEMNLSALHDGLYLIEMQSIDGTATGKLMVGQ